MTRKDTILIAVVINAGLLAILFTTAVIYDTDKGLEHSEFVTPLVDAKNPPVDSSPTLVAVNTTGDEVDNVLKYYTPSSQPVTIGNPSDSYVPEPIAVQSNAADDEDYEQEASFSSTQEQFVEVKVKKGDVLEKIARANKTTVGAIKRANNLQTERLSIGQVLKIPTKHDIASNLSPSTSVKTTESKPQVKLEPKNQIESTEPVYYVIKSGDNPWKIAKQFNVKFDDIVRLNQLDEERARNLKIGDRIRVK